MATPALRLAPVVKQERRYERDAMPEITQEELDKLKAAEAQVEELEAKVKKADEAAAAADKAQKEVDRLTKAVQNLQKEKDKATQNGTEKEASLETLQKQIDAMNSSLQTAEKKALVAPLLADKKAHSTKDAMAFLDLDSIEDEESAKAAVEALYEGKPWAFASEETSSGDDKPKLPSRGTSPTSPAKPQGSGSYAEQLGLEGATA